MHDFTDYVRDRLGSLDLSTERKADLVDEIAEHMLAAYEDARERGLSERESLELAESWFVPWERLRKGIEQADRTPSAQAVSEWLGKPQRGGGEAAGILTPLAGLWQDVRFALRSLGKRPLFTSVAIGTVGLGIGATTTMFSVVDGVLLRQLPFREPGELVTVWKTRPGSSWSGGLFWNEFIELRDNASSFQEVAVYRAEKLILTGSGDPASIVAGVASASFFPLLGVRPQLGRLFQDGDDGREATRLAVLSGELWTTRFGSDSSVVGRTVQLGEVAYEVIGVLPAGFRFRSRPDGGVLYEIDTGVDTGKRDVWLPVGFDGEDLEPWSMNLEFVGRLRQGVSLAQAHAEVDAALQLGRERSNFAVRLEPIKQEETAMIRGPLLLLLGAAGVLSLIACAIVANLLLGEAIGRHREIRTRFALGASRLRITRLLLTESILLGLGGGGLGFASAILGVKAATTFGPYLPGLENVHVDYRVLFFAMGLGITTGVVFGFAPVLNNARLSALLSSHTNARKEGYRFQRRVIGFVFALTTVLLVAGGLLTRSFSNLIQIDTGFDAHNVATVRLPLLPSRYSQLEPRDAFLSRVIAEIEAIPGVIQASGADNLPFPGAPSGHKIKPVGREDSLSTPLRRVLADYHEVMGIPLVAGRAFRESDVEGNTPVVIVSESVVEYFWPGESAVGATIHHLAYGDLAVVGVVGDVLEGWVGTDARPMIYLPLAQTRQHEINLIAKTAGDPVPVVPLLREAVWAVDPDVGVSVETTLESLVADSTLSERYRTILVMFFGISATLLAAVGIFGVTARSVTQRTRELGVRVALGATGQGLVGMILRGSLTTAVAGMVTGLLGALWVSRLLTRFLFGVEPLDPLTYATVVTLLLAVCLFAGYLPTRRIARLDPVDVLRAE